MALYFTSKPLKIMWSCSVEKQSRCFTDNASVLQHPQGTRRGFVNMRSALMFTSEGTSWSAAHSPVCSLPTQVLRKTSLSHLWGPEPASRLLSHFILLCHRRQEMQVIKSTVSFVKVLSELRERSRKEIIRNSDVYLNEA